MSTTKSADALASFRRTLLRAITAGAALGAAGCAAAVNTSTPDGGDATTPPADVPVLDTTLERDVQTPPDVQGPFVCQAGSMSRRCFTRAELDDYIVQSGGFGEAPRPPQDAGQPDAGGPDVTVGPNGCVVPREVRSSCCNPASNVEVEGDRCCYTWCDMACCGRPLLIGGEARLAAVEARGDWLDESQGISTDRLDAQTRAALAAAWLDDARMEHASVASFARFTLELLAVGAPAELVAASQRAGLDEVDHARRCFALASHYRDGASVGPGALPFDGLVVRASLADAAAAAVREGCVGETLAALYAEAQGANAREPAARDALRVISLDEGAHAELAWRFVAWALHQGGVEVRRAVERAFADALARPEALPVPRGPAAGVDEVAWRNAGRIAESEALALAREALSGVLAPCAEALLAGARARGATHDRAQVRTTSPFLA